jgi:hypothetical protein
VIDLVELPSPIKSVAAYLEAGADIASVAGGWVFGHEIPGGLAAAMPRAALMASGAGGWGSDSDMPIDRVRIDLRSYGATTTTAEALARLAHLRMKAMRREVVGGLLLHSALASSGYFGLREPVTEWPVVVRSYFLLFDEREVTP